MATTTNYGWTTPDDTALVKDGASAIRTLGSSIDTSVKSLNAGTTAGDIDYYTSATAKTRIGIGSTGQVLTVSGGVPAWATASSGGMTSLATGTVSSTSVVLSSISQSYTHLYLVVSSAQISTSTELAYRINGLSTGVYGTVSMGTGGTTLASRTTDTVIYGNGGSGYVTPATSNNDTYTLYIQNYATSKQKTINFSMNVNNGTTDSRFGFATFNNNTAITSLTITTNGGTSTLSVGTYTLYGVK